MENASKALIIAGAILLSISIIGIGMFVYQQAVGVMDDIGMDEQQIATYNREFLNYEGTQTGTSVRQLCEKIRSHNLANASEDPSRRILVSAVTRSDAIDEQKAITSEHTPSTAAEINEIRAEIYTGATYTVAFTYDSNSGLIYEVKIGGDFSS